MLYAVVPVKRLTRAKSRLEPVLSFTQRLRLAQRLLEHTLAVTTQWPGPRRTIVVSADSQVRSRAAATGMIALSEPVSSDLNRAIGIGASWARARGGTALLVLPTDLPLVTPDILRRFARWGAKPTLRVASDRHGIGTNALFIRPIEPRLIRFGGDSLQHHLHQAANAGLSATVVDQHALSIDIDLPGDLSDEPGLIFRCSLSRGATLR